MNDLVRLINAGNLDGLRAAILRRSFNINSVDTNEETLLHYAAAAGQTKIVAWLLSQGAIIKITGYGTPQDEAQQALYEGRISKDVLNTIVPLLDNVQKMQELVLPLLDAGRQGNVQVRQEPASVVEQDNSVGQDNSVQKTMSASSAAGGYDSSQAHMAHGESGDRHRPEETIQAFMRQLPEKPWLDIPKSNDLRSLSGNVALNSLLKEIDEYHALNKTDKKTLQKRIDRLQEIDRQIQAFSATTAAATVESAASAATAATTTAVSAVERETLEKLKRAVFGKMLYLKMLSRQELNKNWFFNFIFGGVTKDGYLLRTIRQDYCGHEIYLSGSKADRSGNAVPFLDPCLRAGFRFAWPTNERGADLTTQNCNLFAILYNEWVNQLNRTTNPAFPSFYMWLEDKEAFTREFSPDCQQQAVELLELRKCKITQGQIINTLSPSESLNFSGHVTMNAKGELFISDIGGATRSPNHPHIHFGFEPVIFAGKVTIRQGKIVYIHNYSGHYQPGPSHFKQFLDILQKAGCLDPNCKVDIYYRSKKGNEHEPYEAGSLNRINFERSMQSNSYVVEIGEENEYTGQALTTRMTASEIVDNLREMEALKKSKKQEAASSGYSMHQFEIGVIPTPLSVEEAAQLPKGNLKRLYFHSKFEADSYSSSMCVDLGIADTQGRPIKSELWNAAGKDYYYFQVEDPNYQKLVQHGRFPLPTIAAATASATPARAAGSAAAAAAAAAAATDAGSAAGFVSAVPKSVAVERAKDKFLLKLKQAQDSKKKGATHKAGEETTKGKTNDPNRPTAL